MLKTYSLPITILYSLALAAICLVQIDGFVDKVAIANKDKIFHFLSFSVLAYLWYFTMYHKFRLNYKKSMINAALISLMFGIIIEVLQGNFTDTRQSDIMDVLADALGILLAVLVIYIQHRILIKKI